MLIAFSLHQKSINNKEKPATDYFDFLFGSLHSCIINKIEIISAFFR